MAFTAQFSDVGMTSAHFTAGFTGGDDSYAGWRMVKLTLSTADATKSSTEYTIISVAKAISGQGSESTFSQYLYDLDKDTRYSWTAELGYGPSNTDASKITWIGNLDEGMVSKRYTASGDFSTGSTPNGDFAASIVEKDKHSFTLFASFTYTHETAPAQIPTIKTLHIYYSTDPDLITGVTQVDVTAPTVEEVLDESQENPEGLYEWEYTITGLKAGTTYYWKAYPGSDSTKTGEDTGDITTDPAEPATLGVCVKATGTTKLSYSAVYSDPEEVYVDEETGTEHYGSYNVLTFKYSVNQDMSNATTLTRTGTVYASDNHIVWSFADITRLSSNTRYYWRAYVGNTDPWATNSPSGSSIQIQNEGDIKMVKSSDSKSITLKWTNVETGYYAMFSFVINGITISRTVYASDGEIKCYLTGLSPGISYDYISNLYDDDGIEIQTVQGSVTTTENDSESDDPASFTLSDITTNTVTVDLYRGSKVYKYFIVYVYDTDNSEVVHEKWYEYGVFPLQIRGLDPGTDYKINIGQSDIMSGGVKWIGTQYFQSVSEFDSAHSEFNSIVTPSSAPNVYNLGTAVEKLDQTIAQSEYTRVTVTAGEYTYSVGRGVGDDTNNIELQIACPWLEADEATAVRICARTLASVLGYHYLPYEAESAIFNPAAELGDGIVLASNYYSEIINLDIAYDPLITADISAPIENESDHEISTTSSSKSEVERYIDGIRSSLQIENDKITAMVESINGQFQKLQVTLDGTIFQNEVGQTIINGSNIQTGSIVINQVSGLRDELDDIEDEIGEITPYTWGDVYNDLQRYGSLTAKGAVTTLTGAYIYTPHLYAGDMPNLEDLPATVDGVIVDSDGLSYGHITLVAGDDDLPVKSSEANVVKIGVMTPSVLGATPLPYIRFGQGSISEYRNNQTYAVGDQARYGANGYTCNTAITVPEEWDPTHWTLIGLVTNPPGIVKKYTNGLWVGEEPLSDTNSSFDPANVSNYVGLFVDFVEDKIVLHNGMYGAVLPSAADAVEGQLFFKEITQSAN